MWRDEHNITDATTASDPSRNKTRSLHAEESIVIARDTLRPVRECSGYDSLIVCMTVENRLPVVLQSLPEVRSSF